MQQHPTREFVALQRRVDMDTCETKVKQSENGGVEDGRYANAKKDTVTI